MFLTVENYGRIGIRAPSLSAQSCFVPFLRLWRWGICPPLLEPLLVPPGHGHRTLLRILHTRSSSASWLWPQTLPSIIVDAFMTSFGSNFNLTFIIEINVLELNNPIFQNTLFMKGIPLQCRPHFRGNGRRGGTIGCKWSHSFQWLSNAREKLYLVSFSHSNMHFLFYSKHLLIVMLFRVTITLFLLDILWPTLTAKWPSPHNVFTSTATSYMIYMKHAASHEC